VSGTAETGKRERTKQANRAAILEAAREVFSDIGYGAATVRDVIRRTDLAAGTFYNYFPDKESVFRALIEDAGVEARERVRAGRRASRDFEEFVRRGYVAYFSYVAEDPVTFELARRNAGTVRAMFDEPTLGAGIDELREDLEEARARGLIGDLDCDYVAAAMVGVGVEIGLRMIERDPIDPVSAADFATGIFLRGLPQ
jgi:AcrR family transcriptional regulator